MANPACPCHSGLPYPVCCEPYHKEKVAPTPLVLMRSLYSAYALGLADYIIATTHPQVSNYQQDKKKWREEISAFLQRTQFIGLEIIEAAGEAVTFHAILAGADSFAEKSLFQQVGERWLYLSGVIIK